MDHHTTDIPALQHKTCSKGKDCVHPSGPYLPISEFGTDRSKLDGKASICKKCRNAHEKSIRAGAGRAHKKTAMKHIAKDGYSVCGRGDSCIHQDGPVLPISEFGKNRSNPDGTAGRCKTCRSYHRWLKLHDKVDSQQSIAEWKGMKSYWKQRRDCPDGYRVCLHGNSCVDPDGPLLAVEMFGRSGNGSVSSSCKSCSSFYYVQKGDKSGVDERRERVRLRRTIPDAGYRICTRYEMCVHPDGALLPVDQFNRSIHSKDGLHYQCKRCAYTYKVSRKKRLKLMPNDFRFEDARFALSFFRDSCCYCETALDDVAGIEWDHFVPVSSGGPTLPSNMVPSCKKCNQGKRANLPDSWLSDTFGQEKAQKIMLNIKLFFAQTREASDG